MKIGILVAGPVPRNLVGEFGDYGQQCGDFIREDGDEIVTFSVMDGEIPGSPDECDAWLITGSRYGVYEDHAWIPPLEDFIRKVFVSDRRIAGICFGHQIIAQALGGKVIKHNNGFGTGAMEYEMFDPEGDICSIKLYAWHQDQVIEKPEGAENFITSPFCKYGGFVYEGKAISVQAHPEFSKGYIAGLIEEKGAVTYKSGDEAEAARATLAAPIDADLVGQRMRDFIRDRAPVYVR